MRLLVVTRGHGAAAEAEPAWLDVVGGAVTLTLDDGEVIALDRTELEHAIADSGADRRDVA